ncbi:YHS domain-containing (seleno)protein [Agarilytica rhodophyticola]|uniref:YHS domain-containing (seleno)protein n=1 Tax=Agarilytica rhodophyticola TaxID=1737490 RepID=UPI000B34539E|nr:YHS domain-containing (seleno)protein [Agarilytica rhodophyticola]
MKLKYFWNTLIGLTALLLASLSSAEIYTGFFSEKAVGGYDTVAYFTDGKPKKGKKKYKVEYMEATWYFSSAKNKELFEADPEKYAPQYGGHCAWAVGANSAKAPGNPKFWKIVDDKLYLNYNGDVQQKWFKDIPGFIKSADKNWPEIAE